MTTAVHVIAEADSVPAESGLVDAGMRNAKAAWCRLCGCQILAPQTARLVRRAIELPAAHKTSEGSTSPQPDLFWHLEDMFDFMNIGFTRSVDSGAPSAPAPAPAPAPSAT
jgi:hypothetical protein